MKKLLILILFVLQLFLSCINKNNSISDDDIENDEILTVQEVTKIQNVSENNYEDEQYHKDIYNKSISKLNFDSTKCIENFDTFFEKFSIDSIFQKKWIVFPLKDSYLGGDFYEDLIVEYIDSSFYKFKDFSKDMYAMDTEFDKYRTDLKFKETEVRYQWRGYDNGIYIDYIFKKINNCWFLIAIEDRGT